MSTVTTFSDSDKVSLGNSITFLGATGSDPTCGAARAELTVPDGAPSNSTAVQMNKKKIA
jgi:hypothetical protein